MWFVYNIFSIACMYFFYYKLSPLISDNEAVKLGTALIIFFVIYFVVKWFVETIEKVKNKKAGSRDSL